MEEVDRECGPKKGNMAKSLIVCMAGGLIFLMFLAGGPEISSPELVNEPADNDGDIHLGFICAGHNSTRNFYTLMKSILFYRTNNRLEFHIFVDDVSGRILPKLFDTWDVPDIKVNLYNSSPLIKQVVFLPNDHYSGVFALIKLVAPEKLFSHGVKRIIFLDTDTLVLGDIAKLFSQFKLLVGPSTYRASMLPFIGLVENQSDWYEEDPKGGSRPPGRPVPPWRALGRGFNTGVMLIDLVRFMNSDWPYKWKDFAWTELIGGTLSAQLADQDIMNTMILFNRYFARKLDCKFNLQLNNNTNLDEACPSHRMAGANDFRLVHWNSPYKLQTNNTYAEYYGKLYEMFENMSGDLASKRARPAKGEARIALLDNDDDHHQQLSTLPASCGDIRPRPSDRLRTFINYFDFILRRLLEGCKSEFDVTLAVHLSFDRIRALDELAANWRGPISAAIYLRESEIGAFRESIQDAESLALRRNIGFHLVFKDHGQSYPINKLRNLALEQTLTPYVYLSDVDFVPAPKLYDYLKDSIQEMIRPASKYVMALVVPVFETREYKFDFPKDKVELLRQLEMGTISTFRETIWPQGQAATQYDKWKRASKPYEIHWERDYEPFIVTHKQVARYDERFMGFGWNKVEHAMLLAASGYQFHVLPEAFAIHQYHAASYDLSMHRQSRKYQLCTSQLKSLFEKELLAIDPKFFSARSQNETTPTSLAAAAALVAAATNSG